MAGSTQSLGAHVQRVKAVTVILGSVHARREESRQEWLRALHAGWLFLPPVQASVIWEDDLQLRKCLCQVGPKASL